MESGAAASVAAQPEPEREQALESNGLKRRRSGVEEQDLKRQRTSPGKNSPNAKEDTGSAEATSLGEEPKPPTDLSNAEPAVERRDSRRKSSVVDEKQRSKRLFGALLGDLNQPSDRVSKRRAEIEQRRKAELQKQDDKRIESRQRRLEDLAEHRRKVQERVDEDNMYRRHDDMLNKAGFLLTDALPRVYYRPWELLPHQEDIVADQVRDAKAKISKELAEFEERKRRRTEESATAKGSGPIDDVVSQSEVEGGEGFNTVSGNTEGSAAMIDIDEQASPGTAEVTDDQSKVEPSGMSESKLDNSISGGADSASPGKGGQSERNDGKDESEDDEDHVMEGDEETVIYR